MRKEFNLPSYKLDYVSSYLISDGVNSYENMEDGTCKIFTKNMKGVELESFVHFELLITPMTFITMGKNSKC